jgi:molecular chaperone GrpE
MTEKSPTVQTPDEAEALRKENEQLVTKLKYLQAEFENYRKRAERDAETFVRFAHEALLARLLPVVDEMDAAAETLKDEAGKGVRMVRDNLIKALREAGLQEIPALGAPFDPYLMDAVQQVSEKDSKDGIVREVLRKGYRLHDRILRPAQVVVVRNEGDANG